MIHTVYIGRTTGYSSETLEGIFDKIRSAFNGIIIWHSDYVDAIDTLLHKYNLKGISLFGCPNHHKDWFAWAPHLGIYDSEIKRSDNFTSLGGYMLGTEINAYAYLRNVDSQLAQTEFIEWLGRTGEIARSISKKPIYSDVIYLPNSGPAYNPTDAELKAFGQCRNGIFWSVGHTLNNSRPEHKLYEQLEQISRTYGFQCLARTGGHNAQSHWFPNWIKEIYANGAEGLSLWSWESLYSTDKVTGIFSEDTYRNLINVYNALRAS